MSKEKKKIDIVENKMTQIEAIYIAALGAAKADGVVDEDEIKSLEEIASFYGHQEHLKHAHNYYMALHDNQSAIDGALKIISQSDDIFKFAAGLFMRYILEKNNITEVESKFFNDALTKLN